MFLEKPLTEEPLPYSEVVNIILNREKLSLNSVKKVHRMSPYLYSYLMRTNPAKVDEYVAAKRKHLVIFYECLNLFNTIILY